MLLFIKVNICLSMCLILFALNEHPKYPLVLLANRDEYFNRPTLYAHPWEEYSEMIAGRDQTAGGTWLGITKRNRFAAITNYRDPQRLNPDAQSRGALTKNFLTGAQAPARYIDEIKSKDISYNGYNLLLSSSPGIMTHYSNITSKTTILYKGIHGLSNHLLDTQWPKVKKGIRSFKQVLSEKIIDPKQLLEIMLNNKPASNGKLPSTGIDKDLERKLSSMFINIPGYGTRCTTILMIDRHNQATFHEHTFNEAREEINQTTFTFHMNA